MTIARVVMYVFAAIAILAFARGAMRIWQGSAAIRRFRLRYAPEGRDLVVVYSADRRWKDYIEAEWLPRWRDRAVVLDWSHPAALSRRDPAVQLFRSISGRRAYHPLGIVVPLVGAITVVRFRRAFRERARGDATRLRGAEGALDDALARAQPAATR